MALLDDIAEGVAADPIAAAIEGAITRIAPTWPLDRFIAVNPFWGMVDRTFPEVAAELRSFAGASLFMPRSWYRAQRAEGALPDEHIDASILETGAPVSRAKVLEALTQDTPPARRRARFADVMDVSDRDLVHEMAWTSFATTSVSQFCASYFDGGQATFGPERTGGLFASWRRMATADRSPSHLMAADGYLAAAAGMPETADAMIRAGLEALGVAEAERENYLAALLLSMNGWAAWCRYLRWTAELDGGRDDTIVDFLGVLVGWEWILYRKSSPEAREAWVRAMESWPRVDGAAREALAAEAVLQKAVELGWAAGVARGLRAGFDARPPEAPAVQAAFCIDVRSEVFRRALEAVGPSVQTLGFAGFFGMPIEYRTVGAPGGVPQLPGLLAPALCALDTEVPADEEPGRAGRLSLKKAWKGMKSGAVATFVFVEAMGLTYAGKLFRDSFARGSAPRVDAAGLSPEAQRARRPRVFAAADGTPMGLEAKADLAAGILRAMSLTEGFAPIVLLAGHGSDTNNNPHAAGLDCGACCGQTGEVNARALAALLNEGEVREALARRGIVIPAATHVLPALHVTTTDEVRLFDEDLAPASHAAPIARLRDSLAAASARARAERARSLGLSHLDGDELESAIRQRTRDWSQVRPEWGLAGNAAFIVAPRERSAHLNLEGRSFLHDYRWREDEGFAVLEQIMTAPMVVTHWINMQYYGSTVDNHSYGSGNKTLHNVVGAHVGIFEGNGGDLRTGLAMQSLHDGERWVHQPLRLSVFIEAPLEAIEGVLGKHEVVRDLVENRWIDLYQLDEGGDSNRLRL